MGCSMVAAAVVDEGRGGEVQAPLLVLQHIDLARPRRERQAETSQLCRLGARCKLLPLPHDAPPVAEGDGEEDVDGAAED